MEQHNSSILKFSIIFALMVKSIVSGGTIDPIASDKLILIQSHPFNNTEHSGSSGNNTKRYYNFERKIEVTEDEPRLSGTKWCGGGVSARNFADLGEHADLDKCCRQHYFCEHMAAQERNYGLHNQYNSPRYHCNCEVDFSRCLKANNNNASDTLGIIYFLNTRECYQEDYKVIDCGKVEPLVFDYRCTQYAMDKSGPRVFQWFDMPYFKYPQLTWHDEAKLRNDLAAYLSPLKRS